MGEVNNKMVNREGDGVNKDKERVRGRGQGVNKEDNSNQAVKLMNNMKIRTANRWTVKVSKK